MRPEVRWAATAAAFALFVAAAAVADHAGRHLPGFCLAQVLLGIPCPGCGITSSLIALAAGDLRESMARNAAGVFVFLYFAVLAVLALWRSRSITRKELCSRIAAAGDRLLATALLSCWLVQAIIPGLFN